jgi:hypothetical protein
MGVKVMLIQRLIEHIYLSQFIRDSNLSDIGSYMSNADTLRNSTSLQGEVTPAKCRGWRWILLDCRGGSKAKREKL